jgi:hypothetical protein
MDSQHGNDSAFTAMVARCFYRYPCERPSAQELQADRFFEHRQIVDDDLTSTIASILASPSKDASFAWEHLLSPSTPHTGRVDAGKRNPYRRSISAGCLKSPLFLSPPIPENAVLKVSIEKLRMNSPAPIAASPQYESTEWPSWARKALTSDSCRLQEASRSPKGNVSPAVAALSQMMGSLAVSEDSSASATSLQRKNLFGETRSSGYFSEVSDSSTLQGEALLETVPDICANRVPC